MVVLSGGQVIKISQIYTSHPNFPSSNTYRDAPTFGILNLHIAETKRPNIKQKEKGENYPVTNYDWLGHCTKMGTLNKEVVF